VRLACCLAAVALIVAWSLTDVILDGIECATGRWLP
jgi:hypothetical protein